MSLFVFEWCGVLYSMYLCIMSDNLKKNSTIAAFKLFLLKYLCSIQCFGDNHNHRRFCDVTRWSRVTMQRGCCVITRRLSGNHPKHDADFVKNLSFCDFLNVTILQSHCDNFTRNKNFRCCFSRITYVRLILRALNPFFASMLIICEWNISLVHNEWIFFKFDSWTLSTFIK